MQLAYNTSQVTIFQRVTFLIIYASNEIHIGGIERGAEPVHIAYQ